MQSSNYTNAEQFDCRRYLKPGDLIWYESMAASPNMDSIARHGFTAHCAMITKVYREFVIVKLDKVVEHVNRWNITAVNGKALSGWNGGHSGCFAELKPLAWR